MRDGRASRRSVSSHSLQCPQRSRDTLERICARRPVVAAADRRDRRPPYRDVDATHTRTRCTSWRSFPMSAPVTATTPRRRREAEASRRRARASRVAGPRVRIARPLLGCRRSTGASGGRFTTPARDPGERPRTRRRRRPASPTPQGHSRGPARGRSSTLPIDWQIDFCSRPMKDERGKKMWELLICDESRSFQHAEFFPNNRINSVELSKAIQRVLNEPRARGRSASSFSDRRCRRSSRARATTSASRRCRAVDARR